MTNIGVADEMLGWKDYSTDISFRSIRTWWLADAYTVVNPFMSLAINNQGSIIYGVVTNTGVTQRPAHHFTI